MSQQISSRIRSQSSNAVGGGDLVSVVTLLLVFVLWLAAADVARAVRGRSQAAAWTAGSVDSALVDPGLLPALADGLGSLPIDGRPSASIR